MPVPARRRAASFPAGSLAAALGGSLAGLLAAVPVSAQLPGHVVARASVATGGGQSTGGVSGLPALSADGRLVAVVSAATNLGAGCSSLQQIYVHDRATGLTTCVSRAPGGDAQGDAGSTQPALSADGRLVAFASQASNLGGGCAGGQQVYVRDRATDATTCVSRAPGGGAEGDSFSSAPALSADGRLVAFASQASNLGGGCSSGVQIYVHDRLTGATTCVSRAPGGGAEGSGNSFTPALSADGRLVAFVSSAGNLGGGCSSGLQVYVHDRATGVTACVSRAPGGGAQGNAASDGAALSADGRVVAFASQAGNLGGGCSSGLQVYVHDRATGVTTCVSRAPGGGVQGNDDSALPALSADGRLVAFASAAGNLGGGCAGSFQIYVHDRATAVTTCVSRAPGGGAQGDDDSLTPALSADGRLVAFDSAATNLLGPGLDTNGLADVFVARLALGPTWLVTGAGAGGGPHVRGFDALGNGSPVSFLAYGAGFLGGVHVAMGDLSGDGAAEIVTGAGAGGGPHVRVFRSGVPGTPGGVQEALGFGFFPYEATFAGGVAVATGRLDGGLPGLLLTAPGPGRPALVRLFGVGPLGVVDRGGFLAYDPAFLGGARVAACDLDGDGRDEVVTSPGPGGGPHVRVFAVDAFLLQELLSFFPYAPVFTGGVFVACADVTGDGRAELLTGPDAGGGPHVRAFTLDLVTRTGASVAELLPYPPGLLGGVRVGAVDLDGDGRAEILTGAGPGGGPHVRVVETNGVSRLELFPYAVGFTGGVFVAGPLP
jgi:Tol biopolymer transport system component